jgi:hypothetical protein
MGDLLKVAFATITQATGNAAGQDLVLTGASVASTILSVTLCNTHASNDETFSMSVKDGDSTEYFVYVTQSLPAASTFVHNDKIILMTGDTLNVVSPSGTADIDVVISYLEQT